MSNTPSSVPTTTEQDQAIARLAEDAQRGKGRFDHIGWTNVPPRHSEYWNLIGEIRADITTLLTALDTARKDSELLDRLDLERYDILDESDGENIKLAAHGWHVAGQCSTVRAAIGALTVPPSSSTGERP